MFEMLFVTSSHPLSVCIYSLDNRCKQLTDKERVEVKERIDPKYSEGMNGYISPCTGEPCPPVFRSPVESMEDIMDNQVICAIYRLPDGHKHITRPPAGVIFPKKIVSVGDLKPAPVLWHEESGRKPFENARRPFENARRPPFENARRPFDNARQNPPGSISGRHLEEAAHRLIVNSLQAKVDSNGYGNQMHALRPSYVGPRNYPPHHSYTNNGSYAQGHSRMPPPRTIHHPQAQHRASNVNAIPRHGDPGYNDQHSSSAAHHHQNSSHTQHYERSSGPGYHQSGNHQSGGPIYPQRPIPQAPPGVTPVPYQGGYNNYQNYQPSGPPAQGFDGWVPQVSQNPGRGYGRPQQSGNQYSGLDRRGHRRPPPTQPGYGHK